MTEAVLITLDVDWAPDWMIRDAIRILDDAGVKATFFATHESEAITALQGQDNFEVGIHPNLLPDSSQGETAEEVLGNLKRWFPDALSCRTHSLWQNERFLKLACEEYGIRYDCSIYLPGCPHVRPHRLRYSDNGPDLMRVPHVFQDNMFLYTGKPLRLESLGLPFPGLKIFNFHPVHIAMNTSSSSHYAALRIPEHFQRSTRAEMEGEIHHGTGVRTLFKEVVALAGKQPRTMTIRELRAAQDG